MMVHTSRAMLAALLQRVLVLSGAGCALGGKAPNVGFMQDHEFDPTPGQTAAAVDVTPAGQPGRCGRDLVGVISGPIGNSLVADVKQKLAELGADGVEGFECGKGLAKPGSCAGFVYVCKRVNGKPVMCDAYMRGCTAFKECNSLARSDLEHAHCETGLAAAQADGCWIDPETDCP